MLLFALLLSFSVNATIYNVNFCAEYSIDFDDAHSGVGDDYFQTNSNVPARGAFFHIEDIFSNYVHYDTYTDWDGSTPGCTGGVPLDSTKYYRVTVYSKALVNGNYVRVLSDDSSDNLYGYQKYSNYHPFSSTTDIFPIPIASQWNIAAAAGWAMYRRPVGLSGETFKLYTQACDGGGSCRDGNSSKISVWGANHKYVINHEFGHLVAYRKNGNVAPTSAYDAPSGVCYTDSDEDHEAVSKEFQGAAASEGFAHYYAAVSFNRTDEYDCGFAYYKPTDWNLDLTTDPTDVSCELEPFSGVLNIDYLGNWCDGTLGNRGTEWDWLRFLWDLDTDEGVTTTTIFDIYDSSNPGSWTVRGTGSGGSYPSARLRAAADTEGVLAEWDAWDNTNGVHR